MKSNKILCFEYILFRLIEWYRQEKSARKRSMDFSRLKALKLLFFVSSIRNIKGEDLLDIFNKFYAMEYGPVENDVYTAIVRDTTTIYSFKDSMYVSLKNASISLNDFGNLSDDIKQHIDCSIDSLKKKNKDIVYYSASELVKISHKWRCWNVSMSIATFLDKGSMLIDVENIREDNQFLPYYE